MSIPEQFLIAIAALFLALILFKLFTAPLRLALKVACNTALGFLALAALDLCSGVTGLHIGVNLINALLVGISRPAGSCAAGAAAMGVSGVVPLTYPPISPRFGAALFFCRKAGRFA